MDTHTNLMSLSDAVQCIKTAILQSQQRSVQDLNTHVLSLYYSIGEFISRNSRQQQWGSSALKSISEQLQKELPGLRGYGETSLKNMRLFYEAWCTIIIRQPLADELQIADNEQDMIRQPMADELEQPLPIATLQFRPTIFDIPTAHDFLSISFSHHIEILGKTTTVEERLFYIRQTATYKWDKYKLREVLKQDLYHHQSVMPNNFLQTLPKRVHVESD